MSVLSNGISFIVSQKGKPLIVMDNCIFKLNKATKTTKYYRCEDPKCSMTLRTDTNNVLIGTAEDHNHPCEPEQVEIRKLKSAIKERAIKETTAIPKIYDEETSRFCLSSLATAILPSQREISNRMNIFFKGSSLNKARRLQTPVIPDSQVFDIPDGFTKTLKGELFLCVDKFIKRKTRILLFASREQLKLLFESSIILMDGTFSASPSVFQQVYCLHAIKYNQCKFKFYFIKEKKY